MYTVVAIGDDNSGLLTIWSSNRARPLCVIRDVFAGRRRTGAGATVTVTVTVRESS